MHTTRSIRWGYAALAAVIITGAGVSGCRVDEQDIQRWEGTERGPGKLVAVLVHDKYDTDLRVKAALSLIKMKPRGGRRVGIPMMVKAMTQLSPAERVSIINGLTPVLVAEMAKTPPVGAPGQPMPPDSSIPYKDAAFSLISYDKDQLITDPKQKLALTTALAKWCAADFQQRMDRGAQMFGVERIVKFIGAPAAKLLPPLIKYDSRKITELARLIADNADPATTELASKKIVQVVTFTLSKKWIERLRPTVEQANRLSGIKTTKKQFELQLKIAQDQQLTKLFGAMRKIGGRAVVNFCLGYAANKDNDEKHRVLSVAALEGNFDQKNADDVKRILALAASDDSPDKVRDLAFRRVGEMPRERVISKLYEIFNNKRWQIRWVAAQYAIKMSNTSQIPEIMGHLPKGAKLRNFALTEALSYGDWMGDPSRMSVADGKSARSQLARYFTDPNIALKTSAFGWFYGHGTKDDVSFLDKYLTDSSPIPKCGEDQPNCEWICYVPKKGGKKGETESKEPSTVGEYLKYCIVPNIKDRKEDPAKKKAKAKKSSSKKNKK